MVHHAARAAVAVALSALALSACGGGDEANVAVAPRIGVPMQLVKCEDWKDATIRERYGTIEALRDFAGGPAGSPGGRGATIEDDDAYDLFEQWCGRPYASAFKLYKLYTRAAAFTGG